LKITSAKLIFFIPLCWISLQAAACPSTLQHLQTSHLGNTTLCEVYDRYHKALSSLARQGVSPAERMSDLLAPRLIDMQTWIEKRQALNFNPWIVYDPMPYTWEEWQEGAYIVDTQAQENFEKQNLKPMDLSWLLQIQDSTMVNFIAAPGEFRHGNEAGKALTRKTSVTQAQVEGMRSVFYPSLLSAGKPILSWHPVLCYEDMSADFQNTYGPDMMNMKILNLTQWVPIPPTEYYKSGEESRQCGYLLYADPHEVKQQLNLWVQDLNEQIMTWSMPQAQGDPILVAARAERWLIAIHPFSKGNGRMSRFVMEYVLESLGLPPPLLQSMDDDVYSSESQWADEVGRGLLSSVKIVEQCALDPKTPGCNIVPKSF